MSIYVGLFLIAFSTLSLEITLVRLLSVTTWYHLAFFAISTAMLGMTAGATRVYLDPETFSSERLVKSLNTSCLYYALSIPLTLALLCLVPLTVQPSAMSLVALLVTTFACALPFYFAGIVISATLTKLDLPIGRLYASDLIGASLGCLFVLGGLELFDAASLILLCSCTGALAGLGFAWGRVSPWRHRATVGLLLFFLLAGIANSLSPRGMRPMIVKGGVIEPAFLYHFEKWNSFSRVAVYEPTEEAPQYWGASPLAPTNPIAQYKMNIDGDAATIVRRFNSTEDIEHLRYDVTNMAYHLGRGGRAAIIGVGGGRDIQSAILFGHNQITGVELNPIFIDLLNTRFRRFAGVADYPGVTLVTDEARSYFSRTPDKYSILQMSLIDTWAATGVGAFSLSENSLYTVEAWKIFINRLEADGLFTVSRWYSPDQIGETGRLMSLAVASLLELGVAEPSQHLALIASGRISTLLLSRQPLTATDIERLTKVSEDMQFRVLHLPTQVSAEGLLRDIVAAKSLAELNAAVAGAELNCTPPTDESPYFFNMLRLSNIMVALSKPDGVIRGNLYATVTLCGLVLVLLLLTIATIILPLVIRTRFTTGVPLASQILWPGALYFILIGAGFMLAEIALIQRLTVFLSHPIYALGIILFTIIASTGVGSWLSDRLPLTRAPWLYLYPLLTVGYLLSVMVLLNILLKVMVSASISTKIALSIGTLFPLGLLMGLFFPTGMRLVKQVSAVETPWYWALNGVFGVLCSALAVFISIYIGTSINFYLAALCYSAIIIAQMKLQARLLPAETKSLAQAEAKA